MARQRGLGAGLFQVRTRVVLGKSEAFFNRAFFSGLLIGAELLELQASGWPRSLVVGGTGRLQGLYEVAFQTLGLPGFDWIPIPDGVVALAGTLGHRWLLRNGVLDG